MKNFFLLLNFSDKVFHTRLIAQTLSLFLLLFILTILLAYFSDNFNRFELICFIFIFYFRANRIGNNFMWVFEPTICLSQRGKLRTWGTDAFLGKCVSRDIEAISFNFFRLFNMDFLEFGKLTNRSSHFNFLKVIFDKGKQFGIGKKAPWSLGRLVVSGYVNLWNILSILFPPWRLDLINFIIFFSDDLFDVFYFHSSLDWLEIRLYFSFF